MAFCLTHVVVPAVQPPLLPAPSVEATTPPVLEASRPAVAGEASAARSGSGDEVARVDTPAAVSPDKPDSLETLRRAADLLAEVNTALGAPRSPYGQLIYDIAIHHSVNPHLVAAMIHVESAFNPRAVSRKGACGLMQLLPQTARRFGLVKKRDLFDPKKNLEAGVRYLKWLTQRFGGDVEKILAAYNAGEGAVERFGGIPPYSETQRYVERVFGLLGFTLESPAAPAAMQGGGLVAGK